MHIQIYLKACFVPIFEIQYFFLCLWFLKYAHILVQKFTQQWKFWKTWFYPTWKLSSFQSFQSLNLEELLKSYLHYSYYLYGCLFYFQNNTNKYLFSSKILCYPKPPCGLLTICAVCWQSLHIRDTFPSSAIVSEPSSYFAVTIAASNLMVKITLAKHVILLSNGHTEGVSIAINFHFKHWTHHGIIEFVAFILIETLG